MSSASGCWPSATTTAKSHDRSTGRSPGATSTASSPASPTANPTCSSPPNDQNFRTRQLARGDENALGLHQAEVELESDRVARQRDTGGRADVPLEAVVAAVDLAGHLEPDARAA